MSQQTQKKDTLPSVKTGDMIYVIKSNNQAKQIEGHICKVVGSRTKSTKQNFSVVKMVDGKAIGGSIAMYYTGPADEFVMAAKEHIVEGLKRSKEIAEADIEAIKVKIVEIDEEINFHEKYDSQEAYVADKLDTLINASTSGTSKEERLVIMTKMLTELKQSHIL